MAAQIQESVPTLRGNVPLGGTGPALPDVPRLFRWPLEEPPVQRFPDSAPLAVPNAAVAVQESGPVPAEAIHSARSLALFRAMDIVLAIFCLITLSPLMIVAAVMVFVSSPGPIFYSQARFGYKGEVFGCLKFRTMKVNADVMLAQLLASSPTIAETWDRDRKLPNDPRITFFGHFLRRYSADELPQLFNVLRGDMSIVGPRPLATDEAHFYADAFTAYCAMKPGITGPWQISGRNKISFAGRAKLDCEYARTKSVRQDIAIILRTIPVVLKGTGY